jgi:hypothetical protein
MKRHSKTHRRFIITEVTNLNYLTTKVPSRQSAQQVIDVMELMALVKNITIQKTNDLKRIEHLVEDARRNN